mmetsp:Transcript_12522/g.15725  ORF Transcript_12522/g.15725 Transcript_12522/m.15725 type:complete len:416 (+) Transcript_12522:164-1411(+)|eukprot:CAMPEP_0172507392 /NCGR_PEP_ID=MMETSP1066-20121228/203344_1 /TAXON_ID=671091 /ORGANISM="Coscinodiscus wailesii, Strain CCMP2513" /LENGTH=415 /DNA_ID=CAMNT_0013284933 /DNA_START=159 /DNA_END=1406 /DNA_ORIENTATION=-
MENLLFRGVGRLSPYVFTKGRGCWVNTACGKQLLDITSGIGVTNTGHCHPRVVQAAQEQCANLIHGSVNVGVHDPMYELTEHLLPKLPSYPHKMDRILFATTGAEAVENAVKLARHATNRMGVICFQGGFHGRTNLTMSMTTSSVIYKQKMGSTNNHIYVSPFPYKLHGISTERALDDLNELLKTQVHPENVAAMIIEPVLGEGGYVPTPVNFLQGLRRVCDEHGILLIIDEVQTGFGRCGTLFCSTSMEDKVEADILVMAKGLASGFPLSAIAASHTLSEQQDPGTMGGTYAGNAVSCAAALATQKVIEEENLCDNSQRRGTQLTAGLQQIRNRFPDLIRDVRGPGCMVGVEFYASDMHKRVSQHAFLHHDLLILSASIYPTIRFIPPLIITEEEIDMVLERFEHTLLDIQKTL